MDGSLTTRNKGYRAVRPGIKRRSRDQGFCYAYGSTEAIFFLHEALVWQTLADADQPV